MMLQIIRKIKKVMPQKLFKMMRKGYYFLADIARFPEKFTIRGKIKSIIAYQSNEVESVINFASKFSNKYIAPMQVRSEIKHLLETVKKLQPKKMMEIGTANGGTLFLWSRILPPGAHIISLDLPHGSFGGGYPKYKIPLYCSFAHPDKKIILMRENSHLDKTFRKVKNILKGEKLDFLFIDGDHTYEGVKKDSEKYSPLVRSGGYVAFHDIAKHSEESGCNVDLFWKEIKKKHPSTEFIENSSQGWGGIGLIRV